MTEAAIKEENARKMAHNLFVKWPRQQKQQMQENYLFVKWRAVTKAANAGKWHHLFVKWRKRQLKWHMRQKRDALDQQVPFSGQEVQDTTLCWKCPSLAESGITKNLALEKWQAKSMFANYGLSYLFLRTLPPNEKASWDYFQGN